MKRFLSIVFVSFLFLSACGGVTETGNPCEPETCADTANRTRTAYRNDTYNVRVWYPSGWTAEEGGISRLADGCEGNCSPSAPVGGVIFSDGGTETTSANMYFDAITGNYTSLLSYLQALYPLFSFSPYSTSSLSGYVYDDPSAGTNGGDVRDYFFSDGNTLVTVMAEVFASGEDGLTSLLNGISFL